MRQKPRAAGEWARKGQRERARLELARDRTDAQADGEEATAQQEDRVLKADRSPLGKRVESDEVKQATELVGLRLELFCKHLARGKDRDEQESPEADQHDLKRQPHTLFADQADDQSAVHAIASWSR